MSVRQYIGSRYVPIFADPIEWDGTKTYEQLTVVLYQGNSYTSRQPVPAGIEITNSAYWAQTGNYSAQVEQYRQETEQYRQEVATFDERITANETAITAETSARETADTALGGRIDANASAIAAEATAREAADMALGGRIDANASAIAAEATAREVADTALGGRIDANASAITAEATAREAADTALEEALENAHHSSPAFDIIDRFLVNDASTLSNVGLQAGCIFTQNGTRYAVNIVKDDGVANTGCNKMIIRNTSTNAQVGSLSYDFGHGTVISYNPNSKMLITTQVDTSTNLVLFIDVTNPASPQISRTEDYSAIANFGGATCWYGDDLLNITNFSFDVRIYDTDLNLKESFSLDHYDSARDYVYQSQSCYDKYLVVGVSEPEAFYVFDLEKQKQIDVINMPEVIGHTRVYEVEGITIDEDSIYVLGGNYIDEFAVATWYRWNYKMGNLEQPKTYRIRNQKYATLTIDFANGDLINPTDDGNSFKLLGDAITYLKDVYNDSSQPTLNFASNYPTTLRFTGFNGVVNLSTYTYVAAIFALCKCSISGACQFTTTGDAITIAWNSQVSIQTAYTKTDNAPNATTAVRALDSYIITNQTLNNVYFTRCIFARLTQPAIHQYGSVAELGLINENVTV